VSRLSFTLEPVPPFRLDRTVWALRRRPDNTLDQWDGQVYRRVLVIKRESVAIAVAQTGSADDSSLQVVVTNQQLPAGTQLAVTSALERLLGLHTDLTGFYRLAAGDAQLGPLVQRFRGLKPPRFPTVFETLVNAIACQQVTLTLGIRVLNRLADTYGLAAGRDPGSAHAFPEPDALAGLEPDALRGMGLSRQKARALRTLAGALTEGTLELGALEAMDDDTARAWLCQLRGVGRWTAEYVLLRGLGRLHVFPGDDVGARNNLRHWLELSEPLNYAGVRRVLARWAPYGGLIYLHLLLDHLAAKGWLPGAGDAPGSYGPEPERVGVPGHAGAERTQV
jgi:DNA-3-methyladenine glycosylase II